MSLWEVCRPVDIRPSGVCSIHWVQRGNNLENLKELRRNYVGNKLRNLCSSASQPKIRLLEIISAVSKLHTDKSTDGKIWKTK